MSGKMVEVVVSDLDKLGIPGRAGYDVSDRAGCDVSGRCGYEVSGRAGYDVSGRCGYDIRGDPDLTTSSPT